MAIEAGINWCGKADGIAHYTEKSFLFVNYDLTHSDNRERFVNSPHKEITWTPIDLSIAPEDATHFDFEGVFYKRINNDIWYYSLGKNKEWSSISYPDDTTCPISAFISKQKEKQMTNNIIDQIRDLLPKDAEIAISHNRIGLYIGMNAFNIETIEDIDNIQSALNTIRDYKA